MTSEASSRESDMSARCKHCVGITLHMGDFGMSMGRSPHSVAEFRQWARIAEEELLDERIDWPGLYNHTGREMQRLTTTRLQDLFTAEGYELVDSSNNGNRYTKVWKTKDKQRGIRIERFRT